MAEPEIFVFDSTVMNDLQMCARKFEFAHVKNWRHLSGRSMPLDRGIMIHEMLAVYRTLIKLFWSDNDLSKLTKVEAHLLEHHSIDGGSKRAWKEIVDLCIFVGRSYMAIDSENLGTAEGEEIIKQFTEYVDYYQEDGWRPLEVESPFSKILYESQDLILIVEGKIDLLTDSRAGKIVVDSKTASRRVEQSKLSNQFLCYSWSTGVETIIVDRIGFQKTLKPAERFQRIPLSYPQSMKDEWREWAIYWGKMAAFHVKEGIFPPNFTSCDKFGGCIYRSVCETDPQNREWKASTLFRVGEQWSPQGKGVAEATVLQTEG